MLFVPILRSPRIIHKGSDGISNESPIGDYFDSKKLAKFVFVTNTNFTEAN